MQERLVDDVVGEVAELSSAALLGVGTLFDGLVLAVVLVLVRIVLDPVALGGGSGQDVLSFLLSYFRDDIADELSPLGLADPAVAYLLLLLRPEVPFEELVCFFGEAVSRVGVAQLKVIDLFFDHPEAVVLPLSIEKQLQQHAEEVFARLSPKYEPHQLDYVVPAGTHRNSHDKDVYRPKNGNHSRVHIGAVEVSPGREEDLPGQIMKTIALD